MISEAANQRHEKQVFAFRFNVIHNDSMTIKNLRVSVPITPDVLAKFQRFSDASGLSVSKSIGDWLRDTVSGLDAMTDILESHKRSPAQAMEKLTLLASALQDMTAGAMNSMKDAPSPLREGAPLAGKSLAVAKAAIVKAALIPPLGNTGGKGTKNHSKVSPDSKAKTAKTPKTAKQANGGLF